MLPLRADPAIGRVPVARTGFDAVSARLGRPRVDPGVPHLHARPSLDPSGRHSPDGRALGGPARLGPRNAAIFVGRDEVAVGLDDDHVDEDEYPDEDDAEHERREDDQRTPRARPLGLRPGVPAQACSMTATSRRKASVAFAIEPLFVRVVVWVNPVGVAGWRDAGAGGDRRRARCWSNSSCVIVPLSRRVTSLVSSSATPTVSTSPARMFHQLAGYASTVRNAASGLGGDGRRPAIWRAPICSTWAMTGPPTD